MLCKKQSTTIIINKPTSYEKTDNGSTTAPALPKKNQLRGQAKFQTCEISDFKPCTHAQSNIFYIANTMIKLIIRA